MAAGCPSPLHNGCLQRGEAGSDSATGMPSSRVLAIVALCMLPLVSAVPQPPFGLPPPPPAAAGGDTPPRAPPPPHMFGRPPTRYHSSVLLGSGEHAGLDSDGNLPALLDSLSASLGNASLAINARIRDVQLLVDSQMYTLWLSERNTSERVARAEIRYAALIASLSDTQRRLGRRQWMAVSGMAVGALATACVLAVTRRLMTAAAVARRTALPR